MSSDLTILLKSLDLMIKYDVRLIIDSCSIELRTCITITGMYTNETTVLKSNVQQAKPRVWVNTSLTRTCRHSRAQPATTRPGRVHYDTVRHIRAQPGTGRHSRAQLGTVMHNQTYPDSSRHNLAQLCTIRHSRAYPDTLMQSEAQSDTV